MQACSRSRGTYRVSWFLWILIRHLPLANCCFGESSSARLSEQVLCFWFFLVVRLGSFDYDPFYFLCCDFRLVQVFQKRTSFDFDLPVHEMLTCLVVLSGPFHRVSLGLLIEGSPEAVLVFHWDVKSPWVLLVLLRSYRRVYSLLVLLQPLALIFFYCTRLGLTRIWSKFPFAA